MTDRFLPWNRPRTRAAVADARPLYDAGPVLVTEFDPREPALVRHRGRYYGRESLGIEPTPAGPQFRLVYRYLDPRLN